MVAESSVEQVATTSSAVPLPTTTSPVRAIELWKMQKSSGRERVHSRQYKYAMI